MIIDEWTTDIDNKCMTKNIDKIYVTAPNNATLTID